MIDAHAHSTQSKTRYQIISKIKFLLSEVHLINHITKQLHNLTKKDVTIFWDDDYQATFEPQFRVQINSGDQH